MLASIKEWRKTGKQGGANVECEPHNSASSFVRFSICVVIIPGDLVINGLNLLHPLYFAFHIECVALVSVTESNRCLAHRDSEDNGAALSCKEERQAARGLRE